MSVKVFTVSPAHCCAFGPCLMQSIRDFLVRQSYKSLLKADPGYMANRIGDGSQFSQVCFSIGQPCASYSSCCSGMCIGGLCKGHDVGVGQGAPRPSMGRLRGNEGQERVGVSPTNHWARSTLGRRHSQLNMPWSLVQALQRRRSTEALSPWRQTTAVGAAAHFTRVVGVLRGSL
eukprot:GHVT01045690.1.p1 GENE.GHVT01045690.1~~GHVT01045690.1.p1  ORF type:complete len:175 (-),score=7.85 GHVT01045690.1:499-1023(-)